MRCIPTFLENFIEHRVVPGFRVSNLNDNIDKCYSRIFCLREVPSVSGTTKNCSHCRCSSAVVVYHPINWTFTEYNSVDLTRMHIHTYIHTHTCMYTVCIYDIYDYIHMYTIYI